MNEIKCGVFECSDNNSIYIIGDIHGDYQCVIHCLVDLCKVTKIKYVYDDKENKESNREYLEWIPNNNSIIIFCGDLIHRKRFEDCVLDDECSDVYIIQTILRLKLEAINNGGNIIIISGNHEIMNIVEPSDTMYTSKKNLKANYNFFTNNNLLNNFISNSYAWIKLNDILIAHGGLCSDYLRFIDKEKIFEEKIFKGGGIINKKYIMYGGTKVSFGNDIVEFVNEKYRNFFINYKKEKSYEDPIGFKLFIEYDFKNKHKHNMFWCREWGYSGINCENFNDIINKVNCEKMIIAHCPQFLATEKPKMINFECINDESNSADTQEYKIARVDLGMSRSFEYNKSNDFIKFLSYNHNRKMSVLKLLFNPKSKTYYFNYNSVITQKLSCLQYLLIKYGKTKKEWNKKNIHTNWIGFSYIEEIINNYNNFDPQVVKCKDDMSYNAILCLLYPLYYSNISLDSVNQFNSLYLN